MSIRRAKILVRGAVQGVGFRPFVYRLAQELDIHGFVSNSNEGVDIEAEGEHRNINDFLTRLEDEKPRHSAIRSLQCSLQKPLGFNDFVIRESRDTGKKSTLVLPDIATCNDCLREILDPANRRYLYPFTNCTNCGPRFSIIERLPYDRANTSMKKFVMCPECEAEYHDPTDRRFHAQPNACARCGPQLELLDSQGTAISRAHDALVEAAEALLFGHIVALKGIGGFHLLADARDESAVQKLRERKYRLEKPLAVIFQSLEAIRACCEVSEIERSLLCSSQAPIVLLQKRCQPATSIASNVAPHNPNLGVMLPYSPLHHLLMRELKFPIVATSGNVSNEPICIDEREAIERLHGIADLFLVHNRPIVRHLDDSVTRVVLDREMLLRGARGYAPLCVPTKDTGTTVLSLGAHLKNTVGIKTGDTIHLSQHIGDLETKEAHCVFRKAASDLKEIYEVSPKVVACDLHPDYASTRHASSLELPNIPIQHHYAHVLGCMAEHQIEGPILGVAWDGTGLGTDHTIWGGEFLLIDREKAGFKRIATLRPFRLPGGDAAMKQPCRSAAGLLYEIFGKEMTRHKDLHLFQNFSERELALIQQMLDRGINAPFTSSIGRLFDAIASLLGIRQKASFEGQAAMELEFAVRENTEKFYSFSVRDGEPLTLDWEPLILGVLEDHKEGRQDVASKFHNTLVEMILHVAHFIGEQTVALSGGCFQNKILLTRAVTRLREEGFKPIWPQRIPINDGGIAFGQIIAACRALEAERSF